MRIFLTDQSRNFHKLLDGLMKLPVMRFDKGQLKEKKSSIRINTDKNLSQLNLSFFFNYNIFPSRILIFKTQWETENRTMMVGDTILQQVFVPPIKFFSQKFVFGVRIKSIINESLVKGFSYETLEGHAEKGESFFVMEEDQDGIVFNIKTYSTSGNFLSQMVGPIFTIPYQSYCTQRALENVKRQIEAQ